VRTLQGSKEERVADDEAQLLEFWHLFLADVDVHEPTAQPFTLSPEATGSNNLAQTV
jgi:hypothetical protein